MNLDFFLSFHLQVNTLVVVKASPQNLHIRNLCLPQHLINSITIITLWYSFIVPFFNMSNQIFVDDDYEIYECYSCNREFVNEQALLQHCRFAATHAGEWCERCERLFVSYSALKEHKDTSVAHNICISCTSDFTSFDALLEHQNKVHFRCGFCNKLNSSDYERRCHQSREHWPCRSCGRLHENENNRNYVSGNPSMPLLIPVPAF